MTHTSLDHHRRKRSLLKSVRQRIAKLRQSTDILFRKYVRNLVWEPYLQQVTHSSAIVLWTTRTGDRPEVCCWGDDHQIIVRGQSRLMGGLGIQQHRVSLQQLQPDTTYHYSVSLNGQSLFTRKSSSFRTAPHPGDDTPFTFVVLGDFGTGHASQKRLRDQLQHDTYRFVLTTGDNTQGRGAYDQFDVHVFQVYRDIFNKVPVYPALGNHDYHSDAGAPYLDIFDLPRNASRESDQERYYSFDYGNAHFVVIDSNLLSDASRSSNDMLYWLSHDLRQTEQRWKIAAVHHPPYNTGRHGFHKYTRAEIVPILEQHGVHLVFSGHQHNYQRSHPLRNGHLASTQHAGTVYIVSGAGSSAMHVCRQAEWLAHSVCREPSGIYSRIQVERDRLLVEAIDDTGQIRDSYTFNYLPEQISLAV